MQTGKTGFNFSNLVEQGAVQLRVPQGQLPMLQKGDILQTLVGQVLQGKAQVNIQGESVTLEGVGKQLQDKNITLKVVQTQPRILLELKGELKGELKNDLKNEVSAKKQGNIISNSPEKAISGTAEASKLQKGMHQQQVFTVHTTSTLAATLKANKGSHQAIAVAKQGSQITLHISANKNTAIGKQAPHINANEAKTIAQKKPYAALHTTPNQTPSQTIQINSPTRSIQIGERFSIQSIEKAGATSSKLVLESLKPSQTTPTNAATNLATGTPVQKSNINQLGSLAAGKVITASVGERLPSGNITLQWQQQRFEAPAPTHVRAGDVLQLEVRQDNHSSKPSLRVLDWVPQPKSKAAQLLRQHVGKADSTQQTLNTLRHISSNIAQAGSSQINSAQVNIPQAASSTPSNQSLAQSLSSLQNWADYYALTPEKGVDGSRIANLMRHLGQHFESSLLQHRHSTIEQLQQLKQHDLKALLLQLADDAGAFTKTAESTQVKQTAERGLARIESQQALNLLAMAQADPIRFELPMMVQGQWVNVLLSIQQDMHESSSEHNYSQGTSHHILFALDLNGLGALRVDAHIGDASVHAKFYHENDDSRQFIQENIQKLQEKLKSIGFDDVYLNSAEEKQLNPATSLQFQQLINHAPSSDGLLDIQV